MRSFVAACLFAAINAKEMLHPIREEIVNEIKLKATSWQPKEGHLNHLRNVKLENI